jgi:Holliday junction resolvase RusA-like endonuclease
MCERCAEPVIRFIVPGPAVAWQRAAKGGGHSFTHPYTRTYQREVRQAAEDAGAGFLMLDGPLYMALTVYRSRPAKPAHERCDTRKPDLDNLVKTIADALNGLAYKDDAQICELRAFKLHGEPERVEVEIGSLS